MANTANIHGRTARMLHWSTAGILLYGYIRNAEVTNALNDPEAMTREVWFAIALGVLFAARFVWMEFFNGGASRLPEHAPRWEHVLSRFAHYAIYVGVAAIILTGLGIAFFATGASLMLTIMTGLHEFATGATALLIFAHIAGALWHKIIRRDGVWESMGSSVPKPNFRLWNKTS